MSNILHLDTLATQHFTWIVSQHPAFLIRKYYNINFFIKLFTAAQHSGETSGNIVTVCSLNLKNVVGTWTPFPLRDSRPCQGARVARVIQGIVGGPSSRRGPGGMLGSWLASAAGFRRDSSFRFVPVWKGQKIWLPVLGKERTIWEFSSQFALKLDRRGQVLFHAGPNLATMSKL